MGHATLKLIPGVDQNRTPALNEAAISSCNLIRFMPDRQGIGLPQKLGGWVKYYSGQVQGIVRTLQAWENIDTDKFLGIASDTGLYALDSDESLNTISPQQYTVNVPLVNAGSNEYINFSTTTGTNQIQVLDIGSNINTGDEVVFSTQVSVGGIVLYGPYPCYAASADSYYIYPQTLASTPYIATSTVANGGALPTFTVSSGSSIITCSLANHGYSVGSTFPVLAATTVGDTVLSGDYTVETIIDANTFSFYANNQSTVSGSAVVLNAGNVQATYYLGASIPASSVGYGAGLYGAGGYGTGVVNGTGHTFSVLYGTAPSTTATLYLNSSVLVPAGSLISVTGVTPSGYNESTPVVTTGGTTTTSAAVTFTNASSVIGWPANGLALNTPVFFQTAGTLPTGFAINTTYYVVTTGANTIAVSATVGGGAISAASAGSGTHTGNTYSTVSYAVSGALSNWSSGGTLTVTFWAWNIVSENWTLSTWGGQLISCPRHYPIFEWDPSSNTQSSPIIPNCPVVNEGMFVAMPQRQIVAYGSTFTGIQDPLLVRWCDVNDYTTWIAGVTNQAGSYRIPKGSRIVGGMQAPQQSLLWTDLSLWSMQYVSLPYVYSFNEIASGCGLISQQAAGVMNGIVYWMSQSQFFMLASGGVQPVVCPIWDVIFQNLNLDYVDNIRCAPNSQFNEIAWYYPSTNSLVGENDSYVKYNVFLGQWDFGTLQRTAWIDQSVLGPPIGTTTTNGMPVSTVTSTIYQHEIGDSADGQPLISWFQTGYFEVGEAEMMMFVDQVWPDMKWGRYNQAQNANVGITFYGVNYPTDTPTVYGPFQVTSTSTYVTPRVRNRLIAVRITSIDGLAFWRLGAIRYRVQPDGKF